MNYRNVLAATVIVAGLLAAGAAGAQPGADLNELLALARAANPDLRAFARDIEAAEARADAAGELSDPTFRVEANDIERGRSGLPRRFREFMYTVEQEFPLWGKRELRSDIGRLGAGQASFRREAAALELDAQVKAAFVAHYAAVAALAEIDGLARTLDAAVEATARRLAQARGGAADSIRAGIERTTLETERARFAADRGRAVARLNALLDRPMDAPLAAPHALPPMPPLAQIEAMVSRAAANNPTIAAMRIDADMAERERRLVDKSWYPDVTLGLSAVDRDRTFSGYEAMVAAKIPLRWGLRDAERREATARIGAAESRAEGMVVRLRAELAAAFQELQAADRTVKLLRDEQIPQATLALETAVRAFAADRADLTTVLDVERRLREARLALIRTDADQHLRLAEIERVAGGAP